MLLILQDSGSALWQVTVDDNGLLGTTSVPSGTFTTLVLDDPGLSTSWTVGVSTIGVLTTTSTTFGATNPIYVQLVSSSTLTLWSLGVSAVGQLTTQPALALEEFSGSPILVAAFEPVISVW
jgi:hypothetical protein